MVNPRSRTELVIKLLDPLHYQLFLLNNGGNQKTLEYSARVDIAEDKRRFSLLETSAASSAIIENILVCLTGLTGLFNWFCRNFRCFLEVSWDGTRTADLASRRFQ